MNAIAPSANLAAIRGPELLTAPEALTIQTVDAFAEACRVLLSQDRPAAIDLSGVKTCDTTGLQLLWAAQRSAAGRGQAWQYVAPSQALREVADALGCTAWMQEATTGGSP